MRRGWGGGVKRTVGEGLVSQEALEMVMKDAKNERGEESGIYKWKHGRPLYLEVLKIAQQMVTVVRWPNAPLSF